MRYTQLDPCYRQHKSLDHLQSASDAGCPICVQIFATIKPAILIFRCNAAPFWIVVKPEDEDLKVFFVDGRGALGNVVTFKVLKFMYEDNEGNPVSDAGLLRVTQDIVTAKLDRELRRNHAPIEPTVMPMPEMLIGVQKKHWDLPIRTDTFLPTLARPVSQRTDDDGVIKLALDWLTNCIRDHQSTCNHAPDYLPPRLLDLRGPLVKLAFREDIKDSNMSYAALSHCWGRAPQPLVLTSENITDLTHGIRIDVLPKTFRDAITICGKLSISLLWIDSLCIIQKGTEHVKDWQLHVSEMSYIYSRCILCIAADGASDGSGGLFVDRDPNDYRPVAVDARGSASPSEDVLSLSTTLDDDVDTAGENGLLVLNVSHINQDLRQCPLSTRAWVFQERFLAPRVLHFGLHQIYYECLGGDIVSECFPGRSQVLNLPSLSEQLGPFTFDTSTTLEEEWGKIVESYSTRALSHNSDKLPAIAGVARQFAEKNHLAEYLAGFFHFHALTPLLWRVASRREEFQVADSGLKPVGAYVAPSWSWAALTVPIEFPDLTSTASVKNHSLARTQSYECKLLDSTNIFGQLLHASLTLEAPFCDIIFDKNESCLHNGSDYLHYHYTGKLDVTRKVTRCEPNVRYPFYPTLAWEQLYSQDLLKKVLSMREQDLSCSDRTPQVDELVSITLDGNLFAVGLQYRVAWIRRRQVESLYNVDIIYEGIILRRCRRRFPFQHRSWYTRAGHIQHQWSLFFKHEWDSIIVRDFDRGDDWSPISLHDIKAPVEKRKKIKML